MPRAKAILQNKFPYNISARCINRDWFQLEMDLVWEIFCLELTKTHLEHDLKIHSFVLMSNHFHLIASTPKSNISQCMHQFMYRTSKGLTRAGNRINETYAGRHYKCILHQPNHYLNAYKYNYRNPVAAGICDRPEDYRYSSLRAQLFPAERKFPLCEDTTYSFDPCGTLAWLNRAPDPTKIEALKWGFRRQYFKSKKARNSNRPLIEDNEVV